MNEIYKPPGCINPNELPDTQIRLGIQGAPFTGKTFSTLTFPNPIVLSLDRKVSAHGNDNVIVVPFYDVKFIDSIVKRPGVQAPPSTKDAIIKWLMTEGVKLKPNQTLILDGSTSIEEAFHIWYNFNENELALSKSGQIDGFVQWNLKKSYFGELFACLKTIPGNVIYICHESEKTKDGQSTGKLRALLTGQVGDKIAGNFSDWFRSIVIGKPADKEQRKKVLDWAKVDDTTLDEWIAASPPDYRAIHLWQTQSDDLCDCGTSTMFHAPKYVLANYSSFLKYRKTK